MAAEDVLEPFLHCLCGRLVDRVGAIVVGVRVQECDDGGRGHACGSHALFRLAARREPAGKTGALAQAVEEAVLGHRPLQSGTARSIEQLAALWAQCSAGCSAIATSSCSGMPLELNARRVAQAVQPQRRCAVTVKQRAPYADWPRCSQHSGARGGISLARRSGIVTLQDVRLRG